MITYSGLGILAILLLSGAASFLTRHTKPESTSWVVSFFTGLTLLASASTLALFLSGLLLGGTAVYISMVGLVYGAPALIVCVILLATCLMSGRGDVTRFRVFVLTLGILVLIFLWITLFSGVVPRTP